MKIKIFKNKKVIKEGVGVGPAPVPEEDIRKKLTNLSRASVQLHGSIGRAAMEIEDQGFSLDEVEAAFTDVAAALDALRPAVAPKQVAKAPAPPPKQNKD